jgi:hypothetical protein
MLQLSEPLPERQMRLVRWVLLSGWLLLILSLLLPILALSESWLPLCQDSVAAVCQLHRQPGNRLFWGTVVPVGLLLIAVVSHQLWRRICPLAFVSQLARALGRQRTRPGRKGRPEVVMVEADSWLGRHHLALQWSLLIAGLCLRLLVVNGSPLGLAILLLTTLVAALLVGWAWGGKAWCQYICPMGPVQMVLTGPRGPLGTPAHVGTSSRITQSMCRTVSADGREQSACVACQTPCIDIDAERSFWQTLVGKRNLGWIWYSYPGLILAFFLLMEEVGDSLHPPVNGLGYLRSGLWAFDAGLPGRIWQPLWPWLAIPRLLLLPLLLSAAAALSVVLFQGLQGWLRAGYERQRLSQARERAVQHSRLIASFVAINSFFWFADPLQGSLGPSGGQLLRSLVLVASAIALFRSWSRDQAIYRRESASESLRRQLRSLPGLEAALDGRTLEALSPQEVFTLVKAIPALGREQSRIIYRDVMAEMLQSGRLERARALLELEELRSTLKLEDADHHAVVRLLGQEHPELLERNGLQRQRDELRREAATEAVAELLRQTGLEVIDRDRLAPALAERLDRLDQESGLDPAQWQAVLQGFGPEGTLERQRLERLRADWIQEEGLRVRLAELAAADGVLRPLALAMAQRSDGLRGELNRRLAAAGLEPLPSAVPAAGSLSGALDLLWRDPDPDTAGWALMVADEHDPALAARYRQDLRTGLPDSPFLQSQRQGLHTVESGELAAIAGASLFADLLPEGILWVSRQGRLRVLQPGEVAMEQGSASEFLAMVLQGEVHLCNRVGGEVVLGSGETVGEIGVIINQPRTTTVWAGPQGATLFVLPSQVFEELLQRSRRFDRSLLTSLAKRLMAIGLPRANHGGASPAP